MCARCEHIADKMAPYEPSDDGIDDDGGYGGDFPGGILGTIMEGDSSDDDGGCMSACFNAAGTDETVAVAGKTRGMATRSSHTPPANPGHRPPVRLPAGEF